ncbi:retrovirus-related pol polyprotein from transposon TNT 1-94 [Tanacetum coccineum]
METASQILVTASKCSRDGVRAFCDDVEVANFEKPEKDSTVDGTKSYPVGIVRNVEVYIGKLTLLEDFYVIDMEKEPTCPLLLGRGFLATASAVIDYKKAKIVVGECITRIIFGVKEIDLGVEDVPYWTTLGKRESYEPRPSTHGIGARPLTTQRKTL